MCVCVCVCAYMPGLITDGYMLFEIENFKESKNEMILEIFQLPQVRGGGEIVKIIRFLYLVFSV